MDLDGIMLSEVSQRKTNTVWFPLYVESKKNKKERKKRKGKERKGKKKEERKEKTDTDG